MMLIYSLASTAICCAIIIFYSFIYKKGNKPHFGDVIISVLLVVLAGFRYGVGSDYFRYLESADVWYRKFGSLRALLSWDVITKYSFEVGYKALSIVAGRLFESPYAIFWIVAIVLYIPIVHFCRKYTVNARAAIATFLLFGFWGLSLNVIQQAISMMLVLFCFEALNQKKYVRFVLLAILAESFHTTAIVAILILLFVKSGIAKKILKPSYRNVILMVVLGLILKFSTGLFLRIASKISFFSKYVGYLNATTLDGISRKYIMYGALIETVFIVGILFLSIWKKENKKSELIPETGHLSSVPLDNVMSIIMLGLPLSIVGVSRTLWLANRFAKYQFQFLLVLVPSLVENHDSETNRTNDVILKRNQWLFWGLMIIWHAIYAVLMLDNNRFQIATYLML